MTNFVQFGLNPVLSEISHLCEISDLLLFLSYFTAQNKKIKFDNYFFDVCCVIKRFWLDVRYCCGQRPNYMDKYLRIGTSAL